MDWIDDLLEERRKGSLLRTLRRIERVSPGELIIDGKGLVDFSSNDYLGLAHHPYLLEEAWKMAQRYGMSSAASRLLGGDLRIHHHLEEAVADFKGKEAALLFGSGYLANIGVIPVLCGKGDVIFSDRANHASIMDGILVSRARFFRFRHNDLDHLNDLLKRERGGYRRALVVVETIYSMDGDRVPLLELVELKERYGAILVVDEAHATGVFGKTGAGVVEEEDMVDHIDIIMGTFSKALGGYGAYVASSKKMIDYLINTARSFIYSTALPPSVIGGGLAALKLVKTEPYRRTTLLENTRYFRDLLREGGVETLGSSQIVPVIIGGNEAACKTARILEKGAIFAPPIRPPTVPQGEARIRFSLTYHHSKETLKRVAEVLKRCPE